MAGVWLMCTEIHSLAFRTVAGGLQASVQWALNFLILQVIPIGIDNIGYKVYFIFACFNLFYVPVVYFFIPEVRSLPHTLASLTSQP